MILALLSVLFLLQIPEPGPWKALPSDEDGRYAYRLIEEDSAGEPRRLVLRATPSQPRDWAAGELVYELSCSARTATIVSVRSLDAGEAEMQVVEVPEERRRAEAIYAGEGLATTLYADVCPDGPPLDEPPPPPQIVPVPPRG